MMRLSSLAVLLALGLLIGLSPEKPAGAAPPTVKVATVTTDYTMTYSSQAGKVRTFDLPPVYDDKGKPRKYTKAELQALKGDDPAEKKLPGYKADFSEMKVGDYVEVSISVFKPSKTATTDKTKETANPDADKPSADATPEKSGKWVVQQKVAGKVTKIVSDSTGKKGKKGKKAKTESDPKVTVRVTTQALTGRTGNTTKKNPSQTFDPEKYSATMIVINRSATATATIK